MDYKYLLSEVKEDGVVDIIARQYHELKYAEVMDQLKDKGTRQFPYIFQDRFSDVFSFERLFIMYRVSNCRYCRYNETYFTMKKDKYGNVENTYRKRILIARSLSEPSIIQQTKVIRYTNNEVNMISILNDDDLRSINGKNFYNRAFHI